MRALVLEEFGGSLVEKDVPTPVPGPGEALVRVRACAVDQFDLVVRSGKRPDARLPLILGHEIAGEVAALGSGVRERKVGERVTSTLYLTCGRCRWCRSGRETICEQFGGYLGIQIPGGYAEYVVVPEANLVPLPVSLSFPEGSVLANAVGTPYHAFTKRMRLQAGERVIVTGAGGGVGIHAVQLARLMGAFVMGVDLGEAKLEAVRRNGADLALDPTKEDLTAAALAWTGGQGVEGVLELVGPATMPSTLGALGKGGRMVIVGSHTGSELTIDPRTVYANEWEILGSRNVSKRELAEVVMLAAAGRLRPVVSEVRPLEDADLLHQRLRRGEIVGRAVLEP